MVSCLYLTQTGYLLLADFGLAATIQKGDLLNDFAGTPCYIAPEMLAGKQEYDQTADWWQLGILIYELMIGIPPFNDR